MRTDVKKNVLIAILCTCVFTFTFIDLFIRKEASDFTTSTFLKTVALIVSFFCVIYNVRQIFKAKR